MRCYFRTFRVHSSSPNITDCISSTGSRPSNNRSSLIISSMINLASSSVTPNISMIARCFDCNSACTSLICLSISAALSSATESSNATLTSTSSFVEYIPYNSATVKMTCTNSINALSIITSCDCLLLNVFDCSEMTSVAVFMDCPSKVNVPDENPVCIANKFNSALIAEMCSSTLNSTFTSCIVLSSISPGYP